jgi:large subunit ribosomal protein L5
MTRLKEKYQKEVVPALQKEFGYKNVMAVPRIEKVVKGSREAPRSKLIDTGADEGRASPAGNRNAPLQEINRGVQG